VAARCTLTQQIQGEYLESPGLRLSSAQIQRLWRLDEPECFHVLRTLVDGGFLRRARDGAYVRNG
jgi:hypothetical protein